MNDNRVIFFGFDPILPQDLVSQDPVGLSVSQRPNPLKVAKKSLASYTISKDPSKRRILSKGMVGKIYRCYLRLTAQGQRIEDAKAEAVAFPQKRQKEYTRWFKAQDHLLNGNFTPQQKMVGKNLKAVLPSDYSLTELKALHLFKSALDKESIRDQSIVEGYSRTVRSKLISGDGRSWSSLRIEQNPSHMDEDFSTLAGSVTPTNERAKKISTGLNNFYYHIDANQHLTITCGVINSLQKADELLEGIRLLRENHPHLKDYSVRLVSRGLNSFGNESKLIQKQHQCSTYLNRKMIENGWSQGFAVAHQNRAMNGFTSLPFENKKSDKLNSLGLAVQLSWLAEDHWDSFSGPLQTIVAEARNLSHSSQESKFLAWEIEEHHFSQKRLNLLQEQLSSCQDLYWEAYDHNEALRDELERRILRLQEEVDHEERKPQMGSNDREALKAAKKDAQRADKLLRDKLKDAARGLDQFRSKEEPAVESRVRALGKAIAYNTGLESQLALPKLSNAQKLAMDLLYDLESGQVTQINCKSGLDRTGFARALQNTLVQKLQTLEDQGRSPTEAIQALRAFVLGFEDEVERLEKARKSGQDLEKFSEVIDFQNRMFHEIMIALVITGRSTNVLGLKWGQDKKRTPSIAKNSHPLPYIPHEVYDEETKQLVQLKVGEFKDLTDDGQAILNGLSQKRGG